MKSVTESLKIFPPLKDRCLASNETSKIDCKISGLSNGTSKNKINVKWSRLKNRNKKTLQHGIKLKYDKSTTHSNKIFLTSFSYFRKSYVKPVQFLLIRILLFFKILF